MGLYDWVYAPFKCPNCGYEEKEHGWQTKALEKMLIVFKVGDFVLAVDFAYGGEAIILDGYVEIHTACPKCREFIQGWIKVENARLTDKVFYGTPDEVREIKEKYESKVKSKIEKYKIDDDRLEELINLLKRGKS